MLLPLIALASLHHAPLALGTQTNGSITLTPYKASGIYNLNETAGWKITRSGSTDNSPTKYHYQLLSNNASVLMSGDWDLSNGPATLESKSSNPEMLFLKVTPMSGGATNESRSSSILEAGAAIQPEQLKPVEPKPKDFDRFWSSKIKELQKIPMNPVVTPDISDTPGVDFSIIQLDHINGEHVYGQIAKPTKKGKYPALLLLQWASPPYPLYKGWATQYARQGWLTLNIEPHNVLPNQPKSYYDALPDSIKRYNEIGQNDRDKNYFLRMYLADYRAVDYLTKCPDWDGKTLVVMGTSMGGQQSLAVSGLHPKITHVIVNEPAGCDINASLYGRQQGYPYFNVKDPKVAATAPYFDAINFAPHIHAKALVAMGFVDTIAPPTGIWTAFNLMKGPKEAAPMFNSPHNNMATTQQQLPFTKRSQEWLNALVKGENVNPVKFRNP